MNETKPNIYTAINEIMKAVTNIPKQMNRKLGYAILTDEAIMAKLRPELIKHGIVTHLQEIQEVRFDALEIGKDNYRTYQTTIIGIVRFYHEPSGTHIDVPSVGMAMDGGDKSANKAQTALFKYAYLKTFNILNGEEHEQPK